MQEKVKIKTGGLTALPIIILCLTIILIIINILIPLMGNSLAAAHAQMFDADDLFSESASGAVEMSIENMPNPAAHLGWLNVMILGVQLICLLIFLVLQKKHTAVK